MEIFDILTFVVDKRSGLTMTETYQEIGNVEVLNAEEGTYEFGFSLTSAYDKTSASEYFRFSADGGVSWSEFIYEPRDITDKIAVNYNFFKESVSGDLQLIVEARKETTSGVMTIQYTDTYIRRVQ